MVIASISYRQKRNSIILENIPQPKKLQNKLLQKKRFVYQKFLDKTEKVKPKFQRNDLVRKLI